MYSEKDILARLQAGEDAQTIADEMAAVLNAAQATMKAANDKTSRIQELKSAASTINAYTRKWYDPEKADMLFITEENLADLIDLLADFGDILLLFNDRPILGNKAKNKANKNASDEGNTAAHKYDNNKNDPISQFLKHYGL